MIPNPLDPFATEPPYPCTRACALAEGHLVDVTDQSRIFEFGRPVALTRAAHRAAVACPDQPRREHLRLLETLRRARTALAAAVLHHDGDRVPFQVFRRDAGGGLAAIALYVERGYGDDDEPVCTILADSDA
ncbi:Uncharacterised protein [Nocardia otitidiscaviarum]|uniref:Uncharacterized protein n=1 Tax=Nocardia otitidiscaviarum TaxID=1823 RepID=A0A379JM10_9NOCA|nr:hypothetical protein [Nocardia otitidiscaviarum]SUD49538.1 Uncharacterised protein [Nocardia otitidiscaviarum]